MRRRWHWLMLLCLILMIPVSASANSPGPAPRIDCTLKIANAPEVSFCVSILTREPGASKGEMMATALLNQGEVVAALYSMVGDGWYPISEVPREGFIREAGDKIIEWSIISQSMSEYRIILVTEDGTVQVSDPVTRRDYTNEATYDVKTNQLTQSIDYWEYAMRIMIAVGVTLVVELWQLKQSEFSNQKNRRIVVVTNLFTQTLLNFILFVTHYYEFSKADFTWLLILEVAIPIIEGFVYAKLFEEGTVKQRVQYAVIANISSFAVGLLLYGVVSFIYAVFG
jgi:hypothetical protein